MKSIPRLPDGELEVMQALWSCPVPATRADIEAILFQTHKVAPTTLLTFLSRLSDKGFVESCREGRYSFYRPIVSQSDYQTARSGSFVQQLFRGDMVSFASALCDSGISKEDLKELSDLLKKGEL